MTLKKVTHRTRESACDEASILICMYMSRAGLVTKLTPLNGQNFWGVGGKGLSSWVQITSSLIINYHS